MLQQTQISTGLPYYERWMARFPTLESLAEASEEQAMALWQGLGYYRRCRMLFEGAKLVAKNGFPSSRDEWLKVPGVGKYTASAISSICLNEAVSVVDGNVERVYARITCDPAVGSKLKENAWKWADKNLALDQPGDWNQAVMELGARVCKPSQPTCSECPVRHECLSFKTNRMSEFPVPKVRPVVKKYREEILIPVFENEIGYITNHDQPWWKGLSLLPLTSTFQDLDLNEMRPLGEVTYTVTNHKITAGIFAFTFTERPPGLTWINKDQIMEVPLPAPHRKAINLL